MKRAHFILIGLLAAVACRQQSSDTSMAVLLKSLDRSNAFIANQSELVYSFIRQKADDPYYAGRTGVWFPIAEVVWKTSGNFNHYLDSLQKAPHSTGQKELYDKVIQYRRVVWKAFFPDSLSDSMYYNKEDVKRGLEEIEKGSFIDSASFDTSISTRGMLKNVRNGILLTESYLLTFAWTHVNVARDSYYDMTSTLVGINAKYLKRGQQLEIIAGVGAFSLKADPQITIDGRPCPVNADGYAEFNKVVKTPPGKYAVPVTITFTSPLGTKQTVTKKVEYEIAP